MADTYSNKVSFQFHHNHIIIKHTSLRPSKHRMIQLSIKVIPEKPPTILLKLHGILHHIGASSVLYLVIAKIRSRLTFELNGHNQGNVMV